jgi:hypothetical protein
MRCPKVYSDGKGSFSIEDAIEYRHYMRYEENLASFIDYKVQIKPMSDFFTDVQIAQANRVMKERRITELYSKIDEMLKELKRLGG